MRLIWLPQAEACEGLVKLMAMFPPLIRFFINSWTWGYEDILKAVGRAFNSKVKCQERPAIYHTLTVYRFMLIATNILSIWELRILRCAVCLLVMLSRPGFMPASDGTDVNKLQTAQPVWFMSTQ